MKTNKKQDAVPEGFRAVKYMREVRDRISIDIQDMSFEELIAYFKKRRLEAADKNAH